MWFRAQPGKVLELLAGALRLNASEPFPLPAPLSRFLGARELAAVPQHEKGRQGRGKQETHLGDVCAWKGPYWTDGNGR